MGDGDETGNLVRVKADGTGLDLAVSDKAPGVLSRMLPVRFTGRRQIERELIDRLARKIREDESFDEADVQFAEACLGEQAAKFLRLRHIQTRATEILKALPAPAAAPELIAGDAHQAKTTSDDWVNKFREDAGLVDDEALREIYSRVLAGEETQPGSVSIRTLGAMRYLDEQTASQFASLMRVVFDGRYIPEQRPEEDHILGKLGITHSVLLSLTEAGLLNADVQTATTRNSADQHLWRLNGYCKLLLTRPTEGAPSSPRLAVHTLTRAGCDLARVAEIPDDPEALVGLLAWFGERLPKYEYAVAKLPHATWGGVLTALSWPEELSTW